MGTMIEALKTVLPIKRTEQQEEQRILKDVFPEKQAKKLEEYLHKEPESAGKTDGSTLDDEEVEYSLIGRS